MSYVVGQELGVFQTKLIGSADLLRPPILGIGMWIVEREIETSSDCETDSSPCSSECWRTFQVNPEN